MSEGDFEIHERGTTRELKLLRDLANAMYENHEHMQQMNCYPQPVRTKFVELMQFYRKQDFVGPI